MNFLKGLFGDNAEREVTVDDVSNALAENDHTLIDVREPDEWEAGHIHQAIHIPLGDLAQRLHELPADRPVYTICRSGKRSLVAVDILSGGGFGNAKSMAGGMNAWVQAGKPVSR